jgi:hypothetical protein
VSSLILSFIYKNLNTNNKHVQARIKQTKWSVGLQCCYQAETEQSH